MVSEETPPPADRVQPSAAAKQGKRGEHITLVAGLVAVATDAGSRLGRADISINAPEQVAFPGKMFVRA